MRTFLEMKGIKVNLKEKEVIAGADLEVARGETAVIMGASGAGKTTLLRTIIGLEEPSAGTIRFDGRHVHKKNDLPLKRRMGIVFQKPIALNRSVHDNVAYGLRIRGVPKEETDKRVDEMLRFVGIPASMRHQNALRLSGGEIQRVALARSIITGPELLLLDEPTANLDEENMIRFESLLKKIIKKNDMTTIIATHNKDQAERLGTTTYKLTKGKLHRVKA